MPSSKQIRIAATLFVALTPALFAQIPGPAPASQLPPNPATSLSAAPATTPAQQAPMRAIVTYDRGQMSVTADNASLNQILRDIAQQTGMKITGGVTDERVYGNYGPDAPAKVLALLLNGTGSNMLLVQTSAAVPTELILTPRNGGPTPPNPNAAGNEDDSRSPIGRRPPGPPNRFPNNPLNQINNGNNNGNNPPPTPVNPRPAGTTTQQSPNGVKTPQQIYDQLQQMQQGVPVSPPR